MINTLERSTVTRPALRRRSDERGFCLAVIFLLALAVRLAIISCFARPPVNDLLWNDAVGWNLANGRGFTASQEAPYVPGVYRTPGYPLFLAAIYSLIGHSYTAVFVSQALLDSFSAVLITLIVLPLVSRRITIATGVLYACYPYPAIYCGILHQDILLTFTVLIALYFMTLAARAGDRPRRWLVVGLAIGMAALVKAFLVLYLLVPALVAWCAPGRPRQKAIWLAVAGLGVTFVVSPWLVRNCLLFSRFPLMAAGGPGGDMVLLLAELDLGEAQHPSIAGIARGATAPNKDRVADAPDGEALIRLETEQMAQAAPELVRRWRPYVLLILRHIPRLWLTRHAIWHPPLVTIGGRLVSWPFLLLGVLGMVLLRTHWRKLLPLYATVVVITLIYAPYFTEARYTLPARPAFLVFVAAAVVAAADRIQRLRQDKN